MSGFKIGAAPFMYGNMGMGISFNTGSIYIVDLNFGMFLIEILDLIK
ncbi:MAG: hypothetical protein LBT56_09020 [Prevotellaceae bacterium]|nr:hypothetical protein [Prevotellaceae bacterium]